MKKILCFFIVVLCSIPQIYAVKAHKGNISFTQANGYQLKTILNGDEFFHFRTSVDHFVLLPDAAGNLTYAQRDSNGELIASSIIAHNIEERSSGEIAFLQTIEPNMTFGTTLIDKIKKRIVTTKIQRSNRLAVKAKTSASDPPHYLVLLVNFSDNTFSAGHDSARYSDQFNSPAYTTDGATGSVKQYFSDNSLGNFTPVFDVYGPVTLSRPMSYYGSNDTAGEDMHPDSMVYEACRLLNSKIDFSKYDADNDGKVDIVYVIYAGYGEASGAAATTIWPHAWEVSNTPALDGKLISAYSCSNELQGTTGSVIDGIGTACHEFSHQVGLPDFYDTDYATNGQSFGTDAWDLMDYGCYNNDGKTPCYYTGLERELLGWGTATNLTSSGSYSLNTVNNNQYFKISSKTPNEYFILENRQLNGWDAYIPQHGMVVYHVDQTSAYTSYWTNNTINAYSAHPCVDLVAAGGAKTIYSTANAAAYWACIDDLPFPGGLGKTSLTDNTISNLKSWAGVGSGIPLSNIQEINNVISFDIAILGTIVAQPATALTASSFTASWTPADYSSSTLLNVYTKTGSGTSTTKTQGFSTNPPSGWTMTGTSTYTTSGNYGAASPSIKLASTNNSIKTETYSDDISKLSFWIKGQPGSSMTSTLLVQASPDGTTCTTIVNLTAIPTASTTLNYTLDTSNKYRSIKMTFTKAQGNVAIDDIAVTYGGSSYTYILQNKDVTGVSFYDVTGLSTGINYYYSLVASNSTSSVTSNEILVNLSATGLNDAKLEGYQTYYGNNVLTVITPKTSQLQLFNAVGQPLLTQSLTSGTTQIPLTGKGLYIVKIDGYTTKFIVH